MKYDYKYFTELFTPLGYCVFSRDMGASSDCTTFDLYVLDSPRGIEWFGEFDIVNKGGFLVYSTKIPEVTTFKTSTELVEAIKKYNDSRLCPAFCYCPCHRTSALVSDAFVWYMKTLGFQMPGWLEGGASSYSFGMESTSMVLKNWVGENISRLTCTIDDKDSKTVHGYIIRSIGQGWSWMESEFNSIEEMIASVNSLLEPDMLISAAQKMSVASKLTNSRNNNIDCVKMDGPNIYIANAKNAIKSALENAIQNLD